MAQANFSAGEHGIEGPRGFAPVTAAEYDLSKITDTLGEEFALLKNAYKPYACGLVVHPAIDGCSQMREKYKITPDQVQAVRVRVAPLVLDLCNKKDLYRELQSKYSIYHACAIGLVRGKGGIQEFTMDAVNDPDIKRIRELVTATADSAVTEDQAAIEVDLSSGETLSFFVEQSLGNVHRPLSNEQLDEKFRDQAVLAIPADAAEALIADCWKLEAVEDVGKLVKLTVPPQK